MYPHSMARVICYPLRWRQAFRRRGIFSELYAAVRGAALAAGVGGLRLYMENGNEKAEATYVKLGMTSHYKVFEEMF